MFDKFLFPSTTYRKICYVFILTLILFCLGGKHLYAATYYVSPNGNDNNSGIEKNPFKTIQKGANVVNPGDTVIVEDGVYQASSTTSFVKMTRSGTASNYITFKSRNRHGAIVDGNNYMSHSCIRLEGVSYIRIEGFTIRRAYDSGISAAKNSSYIHIFDNLIYDHGQYTVTDPNDSGGRTGIYTGAYTTNFTIEQNTIHDIGRLPDSYIAHRYQHDHGYYAQGKYHTVINNLFYNCRAGVMIKVDGHYPPSPAVGGASTHIIKNNRFWLEGRQDIPGSYIVFYCNSGYNQPVNVWIEGNLFYKSGHPANPGSSSISPAHSFQNTTIKGNYTSEPILINPLDRYGKSTAPYINDIDNILNAPESKFETVNITPPFNVKVGSN